MIKFADETPEGFLKRQQKEQWRRRVKRNILSHRVIVCCLTSLLWPLLLFTILVTLWRFGQQEEQRNQKQFRSINVNLDGRDGHYDLFEAVGVRATPYEIMTMFFEPHECVTECGHKSECAFVQLFKSNKTCHLFSASAVSFVFPVLPNIEFNSTTALVNVSNSSMTEDYDLYDGGVVYQKKLFNG
jgi:hypothetical protein